MRFSVDAVFKAIDRVSAPVNKMQNRIKRFSQNATASLKRVDRAVTGVVMGAGRMAASIGKAGFVAAAAAATSFYLALNKIAGSADELAKRSRRLQFPIEELQEWQFVAEQSGLSTELFDGSLEKFTKRIGEARSGTGAMVTLLKKQNPELLEQITQTENAAEALDIFIAAMRGTENQLDRTALATAAFGMKGARFLNITEQSAEAIEALRLEMRENGIITEEQAQHTEAYNDAMNSLKKSMFGTLRDVLLPMFPAITENVRAMRGWVVANKELIGQHIDKTLSNIGDAAVWVWENFDTIVKWAKRIGIAIGVFVILMGVLKTFIAVMTAVNLVMMMNPIGLIVTAIGLLIAAVAAAVVYWDELKAGFVSLPGPVKAALAVLAGPIGVMVGMAKVVVDNWEPIKGFFIGIWDQIATSFQDGVAYIMQLIDMVMAAYDKTVGAISSGISAVGSFFGFGDDDEAEADGRRGATPISTVSPQDRTARTVSESMRTERSEVVIKDETGRAEVTKTGSVAPLRIQRAGAF